LLGLLFTRVGHVFPGAALAVARPALVAIATALISLTRGFTAPILVGLFASGLRSALSLLLLLMRAHEDPLSREMGHISRTFNERAMTRPYVSGPDEPSGARRVRVSNEYGRGCCSVTPTCAN